MKLYVHCKPIAVKFDVLTICWANAVLGNLLSEWDLATLGRTAATIAHNASDSSSSAACDSSDLPPSPPVDVKIELIMPKLVLEGAEHAGQPDRPTCLQFVSSRLLCCNYRQQGVGSRADLAKCLETIQNGAMFFGSDFPSAKGDPNLVHPKFIQHATGEHIFRRCHRFHSIFFFFFYWHFSQNL